METTMLIQLNNQKVAEFLRQLEDLHLIKVLKENVETKPVKLSSKYRGIIDKQDGKKLSKHIKQMRNEWPNT